MSRSEVPHLRQDHLARLRPPRRPGQGAGARRPVVPGARRRRSGRPVAMVATRIAEPGPAGAARVRLNARDERTSRDPRRGGRAARGGARPGRPGRSGRAEPRPEADLRAAAGPLLARPRGGGRRGPPRPGGRGCAAHPAGRAAAAAYAERPADLHLLDQRRLLTPDWLQQPRMFGYACYADRFGGDLKGVAKHLDHLEELGVTYLHLMPLLQPREGDNDGGYAVQDYRAVRPDLGTIDDLRDLATTLRGQGISLVRRPGPQPRRPRARLGGARPGRRARVVPYRDYFHVFPDRDLPDQYERTLPEVFPDFAPGSFTWDDDLDGWVWTTFNEWQWDLNWANPAVLARVRRDHPVAGQPRRRGVPAGRHRVPLEADGHHLPEPARGARDHPGAARADPDGGAGGGVQGRGDRRAARPGAVPRHRPARRPGQRPGLPQQPDGAGRGRCWPPATPSWPGTPSARCRRRRAPAPGSPMSAATTTSAGRSTTPTPHAAGVTGPGHRHFLSDWYAGNLPRIVGRGAGLPGQPRDRRPADQRDRGRRWPGSARGSRRRTRGRDRPDPSDARDRRRLGRDPGDLERRRARPAQRPRLGDGGGPRGRQPLGAPSPAGLDAGGRPPRPADRARPGLLRAGAPGPRPRRPPAAARVRRHHRAPGHRRRRPRRGPPARERRLRRPLQRLRAVGGRSRCTGCARPGSPRRTTPWAGTSSRSAATACSGSRAYAAWWVVDAPQRQDP